jgi:DNA polymerase delta subunit 1
MGATMHIFVLKGSISAHVSPAGNALCTATMGNSTAYRTPFGWFVMFFILMLLCVLYMIMCWCVGKEKENNRMHLYLLKATYIQKRGVSLTCVDADGGVHMLFEQYTPYFYAVDLPKRYHRDIKCTIEESTETKPYIGYSERSRNVIKMRTHNRRLLTWKDIHETKAPVVRQFFEERGLAPGWFDTDTMQSLADTAKPPPNLLVASFDVEAYSESREFTDASKPSDLITMIAISFQRLHGGPVTTHIVSLDAPPQSTDDLAVENCVDEQDLLQRFALAIKEHDPDVLIGYNIDIYDVKYIHERLIDKRTFYANLARDDGVGHRSARYEDFAFASKQAGSSVSGRWCIPGRVTIDLLKQVCAHNNTLKYNKKYANLKLDTVAQAELDACKTGFTFEEIFQAHETKDPASNQKLVDYNKQDCDLVLRLQTKLQVIIGLLQLSEISITQVDDVIHRGMTVRVMNLISKHAHAAGFYINNERVQQRKHKRQYDQKEDDSSSYQGAHCFEVVVGVHNEPVIGVDYASLYPSVMRRYNVDPSTLVLTEQSTKFSTTTRMLRDDDPSKIATYVDGAPLGPIPKMLAELNKYRKQVKTQMKAYDSQSVEYAVLNKRQLAIKVCMNSVYGFLGTATSGGFGHPELAASVTAYGRDLIRGTAVYIKETFPTSTIVGGDTDSVYFKIPGVTLEQSFDIGGSVCEAINNRYGYPIVLEMEKTYLPFVYLAKKCYFATKYEHKDDEGTLDIAGVALARGDSSQLTKDLQLDVIKAILEYSNKAGQI